MMIIIIIIIIRRAPGGTPQTYLSVRCLSVLVR